MASGVNLNSVREYLNNKNLSNYVSNFKVPEKLPKGMIEAGNINLHQRPKVKLQDGSTATVRSMSVNFGDGETLIPTISKNGQEWTDEEAVKHYLNTGEHLGKFKDVKSANAYAQKLHLDQEKEYVTGERRY